MPFTSRNSREVMNSKICIHSIARGARQSAMTPLCVFVIWRHYISQFQRVKKVPCRKNTWKRKYPRIDRWQWPWWGCGAHLARQRLHSHIFNRPQSQWPVRVNVAHSLLRANGGRCHRPAEWAEPLVAFFVFSSRVELLMATLGAADAVPHSAWPLFMYTVFCAIQNPPGSTSRKKPFMDFLYNFGCP